MPVLDLDNLLREISPDAPCGEDLSYDAGYLELERLAQGTPEQQIGDTIIPATEPNWREVRDRALELLERSRDLRLVLYATLAGIRMDGIPGLRDGLALLRGFIDSHWENFYPRLDPDDGNDPTERLNIIAALAAPPDSYGDPMLFQRRVQEAPLTDSRQLGRFGLRDILIARGELVAGTTDGTSPPTPSVIDGAFEDTSVEHLQGLAAATDEASNHLKALSKALDERVGLGNAPSLRGFETLLASIGKELAGRLARRGYGAPGEEEVGDDGGGAPAGASGGAAPGAAPLSGEIRSTKDVLLALDKIFRYYQQAEISSPVPLFLKAAQKLVSRSFVEIHRTLSSSDVVRQLEEIANAGEESSES